MSKDCLCRTGTTQILFDKDSVKESFFKLFKLPKIIQHSVWSTKYQCLASILVLDLHDVDDVPWTLFFVKLISNASNISDLYENVTCDV